MTPWGLIQDMSRPRGLDGLKQELGLLMVKNTTRDCLRDNSLGHYPQTTQILRAMFIKKSDIERKIREAYVEDRLVQIYFNDLG
jgi:hypothetical protein